MAIYRVSRSLRKTLTLPTFHSRPFATSNTAASSSSCSGINSLSGLRHLVAAGVALRHVSAAAPLRGFATHPTSSSHSSLYPNWSNPPQEAIMVDGCDFEHWLIIMENPEGDLSRDAIIDSYIKTLAKVVGSEEEARMKIYSVSTRCYYAFGALVPEEVSDQIRELPGVSWVLPDCYLDIKNKDYGGEPFIDGKAVPYDPKYHAQWIENNARENRRNRRNEKHRDSDNSRNFGRENMQNRNSRNRPPMPNQTGQNPGPHMPVLPGLQNSSPMPNQTPQNSNSGPNMAGVPPNNSNNNFGGGAA